jgi:hypothetical protein
MLIGAVSDPLNWDRWPEAERLLEPARARGDFPACIEPDEALYVVLDGDELLAAATAWMGTSEGETYVEVKLVGGRDFRRWVKELDERIGGDARDAGATRLIAIGRAGWTKSLKALGWDRIGAAEDHWIYSRALGD